MAAGMARLEVTFLVDADGILQRHRPRRRPPARRRRCRSSRRTGSPTSRSSRCCSTRTSTPRRICKARLLAEARVEAERILAALDGGARGRRRAARAEERARDRRAASRGCEAAMRGDDHRAHPRAHRGARLADQAVRRAADERSASQRAIGGHEVGEIEKKVEHAKGSRARRAPRGGALMPKVTFLPDGNEHRGRAGDVDPAGGQEGARAGRLRLRRRVRLLDLPRLRARGLRLAVGAAGERGGHPRQGVRRAADLAARLSVEGRRRGRGRRDHAREPPGVVRRAPRGARQAQARSAATRSPVR